MTLEQYKREIYIIGKEERCRRQVGQLWIIRDDIKNAINGHEYPLNQDWEYYIMHLYYEDINCNWKTLAQLNQAYHTKNYEKLLSLIIELQEYYLQKANRQRKILIKINEVKQ